MITEDIIEWVEKQPYWQKIIARNLLNNDPITEEYLEEVFLIFKKENELDKDIFKKEKVTFPISKVTSTDLPNMKWKGLKNVCGVNAIKNNEHLPIDDKITLIYGKNGSGKSGYTRLLNNIFISKGDKNILSNLYKTDSEPPKATILFENENGSLEELNYPEDKKHPYNERITVFDSHSAIHDLTKESELSFTPTEFGFFDNFIPCIEKIKDKLNEEISVRDTQNNFIKSFDKETNTKLAISKLSSETDIDKFKNIIEVSDEDTKRSEVNVTRKAKLQSIDIEGKKESLQELISNLEDIKSRINKLNEMFNSKKLSEIKLMIVKRNEYKDISSESGLSQFKDDDIYNLGSTEWKEFIKAAKSYYETIEEKVDYCIFCKQDIGQVTLIERYWEYLKSDVEKQLIIQNNEIESIENIFSELDCTIFIKNSKIDEWIKEDKPDLYTSLIDAEMNYSDLQSQIKQMLESFKLNDNIDSYEFSYSNIDLAIQDIKTKIDALDIKRIKDEIIELENQENEYTDKLKAEKLLPDIETFIIEQKWIESARECKVTTHAVTRFQNQLFSKYVTDEYVKLFNEECKKLNSEFSVEIEQRGNKGSTLNKLTVKGKKPSEILSEGEQRSLALANFLAETHIHNGNSCMIFDDPVSSLDYTRREAITKRLIEESSKKQIVIFTHDLTFLLALQNKCKEQELDYLSVTIRKIKRTTGIIDIMDNFAPWIGMSVQKRLNNLNNRLEGLTSEYKNRSTAEDINSYENGAKLWCEKLRETWERTIEEILFNQSVQRFNPTIQTQRLLKAPFTKELSLEVEKGMTNCSKWVHDRASGLGEEVPEPDILKEYLNHCQDFVKDNKVN